MSTDVIEPSTLEQLLSWGVVVSYRDGDLVFSLPVGTKIEDVLQQADIDVNKLVREVAERIALDETAKPVVASGPLTPGQERWLRSTNLLTDRPVQVIPSAINIYGKLDVNRLEASLEYCVRQFPALRTQVRLRGDNIFVQVVTAQNRELLQQRDLSTRKNTNKALIEELRNMQEEPIGPLNNFMHAKLFRLGEEAHCLALSLHHMVSDAWSVSLLYDTLSRAYKQSGSQVADQHTTALRYFDTIRDIQRRRRSDAGRASLDFWCETLKPPLLPMEWKNISSTAAEFSLKMSDHFFFLDESIISAAETRAKATGVTVAQQMFASWAITLRLFSKNDDIRIGTMAACRSTPEVEREVGLFANPLVVRIPFQQCSDVAGVLRQTQEQLTQALVHQETPLQDIASDLSRHHDFQVSRLYQTMFAFNNVPTTELALDGLHCVETNPSVADVRTEVSSIDARISLTPQRGGMRATITYKADMFDRVYIENLEKVFRRSVKLIGMGVNTEWEMIV